MDLSLVIVVCCTGRLLCDGPIPRSEESCRVYMCPCVWLDETITLYTYNEWVEEVSLENVFLFVEYVEIHLTGIYGCKNLHSEALHDLFSIPDILGRSNQGRLNGWGMWQVGGGGGGGGRDLSVGNWRGNLKERVHLSDSGVDVRIILNRILKK
jgi:hypothetical protein